MQPGSSDHVAVAVDGLDQFRAVDRICMIEVCQKDVFLHADALDFFHQFIVAHKELVDLPAYLGVFIGIKRRNAGLSRTEGFARQALLLAFVKQNVIGHDNLAAVGDHQLRSRYAAVLDAPELIHQDRDAPELIHQDRDVECHTVSDDVHDTLMKNAGRKCVQGKFTIFIDDGMSRVRTALETNDDIRAVGKRICDLSLALVSPVRTYYCFYHNSFFFLRGESGNKLLLRPF